MRRRRRYRSNLTKLEAERIHAQKRAIDRLGYELDQKNYAALIAQIQSRQTRCVMRQSLNRSVFILKFQERCILAVYNKQTKQIITFLPKICLGQIDTYDHSYLEDSTEIYLAINPPLATTLHKQRTKIPGLSKLPCLFLRTTQRIVYLDQLCGYILAVGNTTLKIKCALNKTEVICRVIRSGKIESGMDCLLYTNDIP